MGSWIDWSDSRYKFWLALGYELDLLGLFRVNELDSLKESGFWICVFDSVTGPLAGDAVRRCQLSVGYSTAVAICA